MQIAVLVYIGLVDLSTTVGLYPARGAQVLTNQNAASISAVLAAHQNKVAGASSSASSISAAASRPSLKVVIPQTTSGLAQQVWYLLVACCYGSGLKSFCLQRMILFAAMFVFVAQNVAHMQNTALATPVVSIATPSIIPGTGGLNFSALPSSFAGFCSVLLLRSSL